MSSVFCCAVPGWQRVLSRVLSGLAFGLVVCVVGCGASVVPGESAPVQTGNDTGTQPGGDGTTTTPLPNANTTDPQAGGASDTLSVNAVREAGPLATVGNGLAMAQMTGCSFSDYHATFTVGGQDLDLLVDSGSTKLAVSSNLCADCNTVATYNTSTGTPTGKPISSAYGDGTGWSGSIYRDLVALGPNSAVKTKPVQVAFAAMSKQDNDFFIYSACDAVHLNTYDGIMGLGPDELLEDGVTSFLTVLAQSKTMAYDAFAVQSCGEGGALYLGGYPASAVRRQPAFVPMMTSGDASAYYGIRAAGLKVGDGNVNLGSMTDWIVDNGSTGLVLPPQLFSAVTNKIAADANYQANFSTALIMGEVEMQESAQGLSRDQVDAALPRLSFSFRQSGGNLMTLSLPASYSYLLPIRGPDGTIYYASATYPGDGFTFSIFGNALMRKHLVIFDRENSRVGFAEQDTCADWIAGYNE